MIKNIITSIRKFVKLSPGKIALFGAVLFIVLAVGIYLLPDAFLDRFLEERITAALREAYPAYTVQIAGLHYSILENLLECDSVVLMKNDFTVSCSVARFSVSGVGRIQLLWGGGLSPDNLVSSNVDARYIRLTFHKLKYELRCEQLHVSVPDSEIVIDALDFQSTVHDEQFFAMSRFRKTRYRLTIPRLSVSGTACLGLLGGEIRCARSAKIEEPLLDILINKDKPYLIDSARILMPNELLASIAQIIQIDRLNVVDGQLNYGERFIPGEKPAMLGFEHVNILIEGASNGIDHRDTVVIHADGKFMETGTMNVAMSIPVASPVFSFAYSGSLSGMNLTALNPFLEIAENKRFKTGVLQSAAFDVQVTAGQAKGHVRALYHDLKIVNIDGTTGSESGVVNSIASFISNNIVLHTTNKRNELGTMKIGAVKYTRARDNEFFEFTWFALRSGIGDVVGF